ncbi:MAG TPA: D-aminoacyl-tRNA deacylase [Bacillota bacterium]|nr:D-aminoacyl-tRNA deacylase [Bacillota bacterium]
MRAVIQRVKQSRVLVNGEVTGAIQQGFTVLLGVCQEDDVQDAQYLARKIANLRVFEDLDGKMNVSLKEVEGKVLAVSQFTLLGDTRKGNRPSFVEAAPPEKAKTLYDAFTSFLVEEGITVEEGIFQAEMMVEISNDGPVTILMDSKKVF